MKLDENILCFFEKISSTNVSQNELVKNVIEGNWRENLESNKFNEFLSNRNHPDGESKLAFGVSCLLAFIQENFTGPSDEIDCFKRLETNDSWKLEELATDGIEINSNMKLLHLLLIAKTFIEELLKVDSNDPILCVWYMRTLKVHQNALDENSITLYDQFRKMHEKMVAENKLNGIKNQRFKFLIELEIISIYLMYRRVNKAEEMLNQLKSSYQIEVVEEGILGMRTKWQQKALPQFHVTIQQANSELDVPCCETHGDTELLKLLELDDDTRLESVKFLDDKHNQLQHLSSMIQNFILITIRFMQISQPKDKLSDEEIQPYLMLLLKQDSGPWPIRLNALLINIASEANHRRTVDRSLRQCEDIVNYIGTKGQSTAKERQSYIFSSLMTPKFKIQAQLADLMVSLGLTKGALDIYLETHQWENVINCYTRLQMRHKASEIIQQELEKKPTAKLYCLLGDATDDVSCYERAWDFSKHRSGLAQRHWGMYYFAKVDYEQAIPHLQKSLEINSLQENLWLRLGYAALSIENYELASSAYIRYTQLEPNGFESWNNLAKCFIKMGNKKRAHKVLQESLKCNFDNWKIWENFLLVSVDTGNFEDALNAYNRLIELKEKYFDEEVLTILINAIQNDFSDSEGKSAYRLRKKALEMLAHLGSLHATEGSIWELSALLTDQPLKKAEKLQKAYKGLTAKIPDWSKSETTTLKLLKLSHDLCLYSLEACKEFQASEKMLVLSQLSSARLTTQGCIKVAKNNDWISCNEIISTLNALIDDIVTKIKELK